MRDRISEAPSAPTADPLKSAKMAGLRYVSDTSPGIRRQRRGRGFTYLGIDGRVIRDPVERQRIEALAIPPAWTDVWISPLPYGHLQATGRDAKVIGGTAGVGAIIGAITGGGKGAATGAAVGGAAGTGAVLVTKGKEVDYPAESRLTFTLDRELTVTR